MNKVRNILITAIPLLFMIGCIPLVQNDYLLTFLYCIVIIVTFFITREKLYVTLFLVGFLCMTVSEYLFISTGVETFNRNSLFGLMPLWLPFLWGYGFTVIARGIKIIEK